VVPADLPTAKGAPPPRPGKPPPPPRRSPDVGKGLSETDLPVPAAGLPAVRSGVAAPSFEVDLPTPVADLPVATASLPSVLGGRSSVGASPAGGAGLPVVVSGLPIVSGSLPVVASGLPVPAQVLPSPAFGRNFGELDLPMVTESLPTVTEVLPRVAEVLPKVAESLPTAMPLDRQLPVAQSFDAPLGAFGEIDLPREGEPAPPMQPSKGKVADSADFGDVAEADPVARSDSADFGDLELDEARATDSRSRGSRAPPPPQASPTDGGASYGEVDFGDVAGSAEAHPSIEPEPEPEEDEPSPFTNPSLRPDNSMPAAAEMAMPIARAPVAREQTAERAKLTKGKLAAVGVAVAVILGGAALQVTPYGAFGYVYITDLLRAGDYARGTVSAMHDTQAALALDTYDAANAAIDATLAAHGRMPRARSLTAYAAIADFERTLRFGSDSSRASRAAQLLADIPPDVVPKYLDVAQAGRDAEGGSFDKAGPALEEAEKRYALDPIVVDIAYMRGEVALAVGDGAAARNAFQHALDLTKSPRAHFGLARAYDLLGDASNTKTEINATLALSPLHPGALTLRARRQSAVVDPAQAVPDIALVLEGAARAKASPSELSTAYAARAWVTLERGGTVEAREAFAQAVKLDPSNVEALNGEGRLFIADGQYAEALARFDTALARAPNSPQTIANDADAKLALERLADAKQQLVTARDRFPKSIPILLSLGRVEQHLGNNDAAEADLRATIANVDPLRPDAVLPFVALSELQSARGRLSDARATLDAAAAKLPRSSELERAFGEVAELQGDFDGAIDHYRAAVTAEPKDLAARFHLAVAQRRIHRYDAAVAELDRVAAVDPDYPGMMLERGLLFEETGDVERAIEQFKGALARAPDDPDLQLRVGAAYVTIGRPDDALPMLKKVLEKRPSSAEAHHYMGRALLLKGGSTMADSLQYLKRAVELDPNRAEFHVYVARAANEMAPAQLELARDEVDRALALDRNDGDAYWQRGVLERMEGAIDDSMKDEAHALQLRPSRYEAYATIAECHEDRNESADALAAWARAIAGDANVLGADGQMQHPFWHFRYGKLLTEKGDRAHALVHLLGAATAAEKLEMRPAWLTPLEYLTADGLRAAGRKADAIEHYRRFLDVAPVTSPDRADAKAALLELGGSER
jgi:tetratricopeptide (TPR) repeat protein